MEFEREVVFYFSKELEGSDLAEFTTSVLNIKVNTLEDSDDNTVAFLLLDNYEADFPFGVILTSKIGFTFDFNSITLAKLLATHYKVEIATSLPVGHKDRNDPYYWCLIEPNGEMFQVSEDTNIEVEGLKLDYNTKRPLLESE